MNFTRLLLIGLAGCGAADASPEMMTGRACGLVVASAVQTIPPREVRVEVPVEVPVERIVERIVYVTTPTVASSTLAAVRTPTVTVTSTVFVADLTDGPATVIIGDTTVQVSAL